MAIVGAAFGAAANLQNRMRAFGNTDILQPDLEMVKIAAMNSSQLDVQINNATGLEKDMKTTQANCRKTITALKKKRASDQTKKEKALSAVNVFEYKINKTDGLIDKQQQTVRNIGKNLETLESKKNTLNKFNFNQIGVFQGMVQFSDPLDILSAISLYTDEQWLHITRRPLETIIDGLNRLNFHLNPRIPGNCSDGQRHPFLKTQKIGVGSERRNESLLSLKRRFMRAVGFSAENPQLFEDPAPVVPALGAFRGGATAVVPAGSAANATAGIKRKASLKSDGIGMDNATVNVNYGTMDVSEAQAILLSLERPQLDAIGQAIKKPHIPRTLMVALRDVPKLAAVVACLRGIDKETLEDVLGGAMDIVGPPPKKQKRGTPTKTSAVAASMHTGNLASVRTGDGSAFPPKDSNNAPSLKSGEDANAGALDSMDNSSAVALTSTKDAPVAVTVAASMVHGKGSDVDASDEEHDTPTKDSTSTNEASDS